MKDNIGGASGGGAATFGGTNYQASVSAWLFARMLAERPVFPVGPTGHGQYVRFETSEPTDDILVGTVEGGHSFVQAKRTISLSSSPQSEFASVVSQFVRQFLRSTSGQLVRPWSHKLEASRDRLVLVTTSDSPDTIRLNLLQLLERLKGLVEGQPLKDAATNQGQHEALQIISDHIMRIWREEVGQEPTESDLRAILKLISVVILDVEPERSDRRETLNLIALGVAAQPSQDAAVWSILETQAADLSQKRSGADIAKIREILKGSGISLRAAPSYEPDIQRLREYSAASLSYAAHNSEIPIDGGVLKINRDVAVALRTLSEKDSLVIVGVPGSGKTGVLHDFADDLLAHARDVIFLSVDHVAGKSLGELRNEMGLSHDLVSIISNWTGNQTGFLIIDSLDAQRGDPASDALLTLIQQVIDRKSRWRVIASIRKYDLRYNPELQNLFRGNLGDDCPSNFCDTEYRHLRHINVPVLSEGELDQLTKAAPHLAALVQSASPNLHELLRVPFNLKLAADIIASGAAISEFQPITTQTELLERYWANRVGGALSGALREQVLRKICEQMLRDRRLRTERRTVAVPEIAQALEDLLSGHVLEEWQPATSAIPVRQIISFSHHIIFDFAVSQLYLKHDIAELVGQLASDPDVFVMARPSVLTRYDQLWRNDRPTFWRLLFTVCLEEHIPQFGKLIGADVIVNNSRALADLSPLIDGLKSTDDATNKAAHITFRFLVGALSAGPRDALVGPTAGPFCELLDVVTEHPRPESVGYMQTLLKTTLESPALLTSDQIRLAGNAARRILEFAWRQTRRDSWTITNAIRSVCITFGGNPAESGALLRQCIQLDHLHKYGYEEMSCLARYVNELIQYDAQLMSDIYAAAFAWEETSTETTEMGAGRILVLTSDRRQDYKHAQWQLAQEFPHFVRFSPLEATTAVCAVMDAYCAREHRSVLSEPVPDVFEVGGTRATVIADYSYIWDESFSSKDDDEITILDAFFRDLEQRIQNPAEAAITSAIWNALVRCAKQAVIWRHLLELGTKYPAEFGLKIKELAWATPILRGMDTEGAAAEYVGAIFALLGTAERRKVEEVIASLAFSTANNEAAREDQRQLLNRISYSDLVTSEAKVLADTLGSKDSVTPVPRPRRRIEAGAFAMPDDDFYKDFLGVSTTDPSNKKVLDLLKPVQTFQALHLNNPPSQTEAEAILPQVQQLISDLHTNRDSVDPKLIASSNGLIAATCAVFARMTSLSCDTALGSFALSELMRLKDFVDPLHKPQTLESFDKTPTWGSATARVEVAAGLAAICKHRGCWQKPVLEAVDDLSRDPAPEVRYQVFNHILSLYETANDKMWSMLEAAARQENSMSVLRAIAHDLNRLAGAHPEKTFPVLRTILERTVGKPHSEEARLACLQTVLGLYVWRNCRDCREVLYGILAKESPQRYEVSSLLSGLRQVLTHGSPANPDQEQDGIRQRGVEFFDAIASAACDEYFELREIAEGRPLTEEELAAFREAIKTTDHCASELLFASGVFDQQHAQPTVSFAQQDRFYTELTPTIDKLAITGYPKTVHHLVEMLEVFMPINPKRVFLQVATLIEHGKRWGYQYESLAVDKIVAITSRYIAGYRALLQEDPECRAALRTILDAFVEAGWPQAQRLSYRLDEIFR